MRSTDNGVSPTAGWSRPLRLGVRQCAMSGHEATTNGALAMIRRNNGANLLTACSGVALVLAKLSPSAAPAHRTQRS